MKKTCGYESAFLQNLANFTWAQGCVLGWLFCMISPDTTVDTSDEDQGNRCRVCHTKKRSTVSVSDISADLIALIEETNDIKLVSTDIICTTDISRYSLMTGSRKSDPSKSEVPGSVHQSRCGYCFKNLLVKPTERSPQHGSIVGVSAAECIDHRHLGNKDGFVPIDRRAFVKYAVRVKHRKWKKRIYLNTCICHACYTVLFINCSNLSESLDLL